MLTQLEMRPQSINLCLIRVLREERATTRWPSRWLALPSKTASSRFSTISLISTGLGSTKKIRESGRNLSASTAWYWSQSGSNGRRTSSSALRSWSERGFAKSNSTKWLHSRRRIIGQVPPVARPSTARRYGSWGQRPTRGSDRILSGGTMVLAQSTVFKTSWDCWTRRI